MMDLLRAREDEAALCRELRSVYEDLYTVVRNRQYEQVAQVAERTHVLVGCLQQLASAVEPARRCTAGGLGPDERLVELSADTVRSLSEILRLREVLMEALRDAAADTQAALTRLGQGRVALGSYRHPRSTAPRLRSCRA
jgi:hypothetical protein